MILSLWCLVTYKKDLLTEKESKNSTQNGKKKKNQKKTKKRKFEKITKCVSFVALPIPK